MLLDQLTPEEKKAFWNIANLLASSDGSAREEESILEQYNEDGGDIHIDDAVDYAYEEQQGEDGSFAAAREVDI